MRENDKQHAFSAPKRALTVSLLGVTAKTNNYGVRVLLTSAVALLDHSYPEYEIVVLDYGRAPECWQEQLPFGTREVRLINLRFSWKLHLPNNVFVLLAVAACARVIPSERLRRNLLCRNPWLRQILESEANLSIAGGDSFSDIYGLERILYVSLPQLLVLLLGKPLVQLPQTYGPFQSRASRVIARFLLRRSRVVCSRDPKGAATIDELLGHDGPPVVLAPDLGFAMESAQINQQILCRLEALREQSLLVGLNVSKLLYMGGYTRSNMFGLKEEYPALVKQLISFLIGQIKATVLLVPHVCGGLESKESEVTLNRQLHAELQPKYGERLVSFDEHLNHRQVKAIIGCCDLFIGARMHACIAAVSQCVPTIALAYSDKFAGVMEAVGSAVRVVDLRRADTAGVFGAVSNLLNTRSASITELTRKIPEIQSRIHGLFEGSLRPVLSKPVEHARNLA